MKWVATATLIMHYPHRHRGIRHTYVGRIMNVFPCLWNLETQCCTWSRCSWKYQSCPPAFGCWHPVPKSMVWCRTCISVFASYNTSSNENAPFSRWVKSNSNIFQVGPSWESILNICWWTSVVIFWKCFFQSSAKGTSREFSTKFGLCGGATTSQFLEDFPEKQSIESLVWLIQPPFFHHDWCLSYNFHGWITILLPYSQSLRPDKKAMARSAQNWAAGSLKIGCQAAETRSCGVHWS